MHTYINAHVCVGIRNTYHDTVYKSTILKWYVEDYIHFKVKN